MECEVWNLSLFTPFFENNRDVAIGRKLEGGRRVLLLLLMVMHLVNPEDLVSTRCQLKELKPTPKLRKRKVVP